MPAHAWCGLCLYSHRLAGQVIALIPALHAAPAAQLPDFFLEVTTAPAQLLGAAFQMHDVAAIGALQRLQTRRGRANVVGEGVM